MKKTRILALVIAVFSLVTLLFLVSCGNDSGSGSGSNCAETGKHKWNDKSWKYDVNSATCLEDGTESRKCPICKRIGHKRKII